MHPNFENLQDPTIFEPIVKLESATSDAFFNPTSLAALGSGGDTKNQSLVRSVRKRLARPIASTNPTVFVATPLTCFIVDTTAVQVDHSPT